MFYDWLFREDDPDLSDETDDEIDDEIDDVQKEPITLDKERDMKDYVPDLVAIYDKIFDKIWVRTKDMKDRLDIQQHRLHKKNTIIQLSVVYLSAISAAFQALTSPKYELIFDKTETMVNESTSTTTEELDDRLESNIIADIMPYLTLFTSTYSSIIIATARHLKIEERIGRVCNIKERFAELLSRAKYYRVLLRPWKDPNYYLHDPKRERFDEWVMLVKKIDKEYHHLVDIRKELYVNYYKTIHVSSYNKYSKVADKYKREKHKRKAENGESIGNP